MGSDSSVVVWTDVLGLRCLVVLDNPVGSNPQSHHHKALPQAVQSVLWNAVNTAVKWVVLLDAQILRKNVDTTVEHEEADTRLQ